MFNTNGIANMVVQFYQIKLYSQHAYSSVVTFILQQISVSFYLKLILILSIINIMLVIKRKMIRFLPWSYSYWRSYYCFYPSL